MKKENTIFHKARLSMVKAKINSTMTSYWIDQANHDFMFKKIILHLSNVLNESKNIDFLLMF
jgi:hypothetical protein